MAFSILVVLLSPFSSSLSLGPDGFIVHLCELKRRNSVDFVMLAMTGSGIVAMERDTVRLSDKGAVATSLEPIRLWGWRRHRRTVFWWRRCEGSFGGWWWCSQLPLLEVFCGFFVCRLGFAGFDNLGDRAISNIAAVGSSQGLFVVAIFSSRCSIVVVLVYQPFPSLVDLIL